LKFGDVVTAVASLVVIGCLLDSVLLATFVPMNPRGGTAHTVIIVAEVLWPFVASLIVGYVFVCLEDSGGVCENSDCQHCCIVYGRDDVRSYVFGREPVSKPMVEENVNSMYSTSGWTNYHWFVTIFMVLALYVCL
jgi:hypothetical protein